MAKKHRRFIPNILTLTNMFLGFLAIGLILQKEPLKAGNLIIIAGLLDAFDGKIARLLGIESRFGVEFDSMADTISFCVVPAILVNTVYVNGLHPLLGSAVSFLPLMFGTIRLAKFNTGYESDAKNNYTIGLTTPISTITIFSFLMFNFENYGTYGDPRTFIIILSLVCFLMVSPVHFIKFPLLSFKSGKKNTIVLIIFIFCSIGLVLFKGLLLFPITILFIGWNIVFWSIKLNKKQAEINN